MAAEKAPKSRVEWTPQQQAGISTTGRSLLLSAAAGSGKTAVLAERCAYLVCDAENPCDVDQLLVVTFTEAAAAEMKGRIEEALRGRLAKSNSPRLHRQLALIERAQVSTLHGFCARLLRQYFHLVELDPEFRILDGDEGALLKREAARALFDQRYERDAGGQFQSFIDGYGDGRDEALMAKVMRSHEMLRSLVDPAGWLAAARHRIAEGAKKPLATSELGKELLSLIRCSLDDLQRRCDESVALLRRSEGCEKYLDGVEELKGILGQWNKAFGRGNIDALAERVRAFEPPRKPSVRKTTAGQAAASAAYDAVRDSMSPKCDGTLQDLSRFTSTEWSDGLRNILPSAEMFLGLVEEFGALYEQAKRDARGIDFSDLEVLSLRVLRDAGASKLGAALRASAAARVCQKQFDYVLVDEYQDINEVQDAILQLVSRHKEPAASAGGRGNGEKNAWLPNLFCVGDVKQSIYRFRLAEPQRFLDLYQEFKGSGGGMLIDLQSNFRSRAGLLDAINAMFARLMTAGAADITYNATHELRPGAAFPPPGALDGDCFKGTPVELHLLASGPAASAEAQSAEEGVDASGKREDAADLDRTEREAAFVAWRIRQMMGSTGSARMQVVDRDEGGEKQYRPIRYRDIVILLRSMQFKAEQFAEQLRLQGIPSHRDSNTGYFQSVEIGDVLSLLSVLDNARQDIPLAAVLRSPLLAIEGPEEAMARARIAYREADPPVRFHEAVRKYAEEGNDAYSIRLAEGLATLKRWRAMAQQRPLAEVLWTIYQETGYLAYAGGLSNGEQRVANLIDFHGKAAQFGGFARQGLYRFLQYIHTLEEESDLGLPSVLGEGDDVVRIMSIHHSKGLEFPVVLLPDLGKKINMGDCGDAIVVDRRRYLGLMAVDENRQVRYPTLASALVDARLRQQSLAEELRVLYVAMTRAKEHLILVGTTGEKSPEKWRTMYPAAAGPLADERILAAHTMLDWVGPVASALAADGKSHYCISWHSNEEAASWLSAKAEGVDNDRLGMLARLQPLRPAPREDGEAMQLIGRLTRSYPYPSLTQQPAASAATTWAKGRGSEAAATADRADFAGVEATELDQPQFLLAAGEIQLSAAEIGDATHLVLQHLDFSRACTGTDLAEQIQSMVHRKLLGKIQAEAVDHGAIEWFVETEPGRLARKGAGALRREMAFNLALPVSGAVDSCDVLLVRGRIDLLVPTPGGFVVIDYKTDRVTEQTLGIRAASYAPQIDLYRRAIERIGGQKLAGAYLIFLHPRRVWDASAQFQP